jgi:cytochrome P450
MGDNAIGAATAVAPEPLGDEFIQDPYDLYRRLRDEGPVRPVLLPRGLKVWLVTRYADVRAALVDPSISKDFHRFDELFTRHTTATNLVRFGVGERLQEHMLNSDPPDHSRLRKLVNAGFTARRMEQLRPRIEAITATLLDDIAASAAADGVVEIDLLDSFAFPLPITVICELLGIPDTDRDDFRRWSNIVVSGGGVTPEVKEAAANALADYVVQLVADKRANGGDDLVAALVQAGEDHERLSSSEIVSMISLLLVAGFETTVNLIGNGTLALLRHPEQFAALRADPSLLHGAIEEFLRYEGPINTSTFRYTNQPTEIGGVEIPADEFVLVALAAANRDPERYPEPDRLDITRDAGGHVAFGYGIHYCLGAPLARLEGEIAFGALLARFPRLELAVPADDLRWRFGSLIRGLEQLPVRLS